MKGLPYFIFNDRSSSDFGLIITEAETYVSPKRDVSFIEIPGRSGDLLIDNGRFENVAISYKAVLPADNAPERMQVINAWLHSSSGYRKLYDSYHPGYFRLANLNSGYKLKRERMLYSILIDFNCKPFLYHIDGENPITLNEPGFLINSGNYFSLPKLKIYCSGSTQFSVNDTQVVLENLNGCIQLDSETLNASNGEELLNDRMRSTAFPVLKPGRNIFDFNSDEISKIEVIPRWRSI